MTAFSIRCSSYLILLIAALATTAASAQETTKKVRVYVLAGQSNMQGHGVVDLDDERDYNGGKGNLNEVMKQRSEDFAYLRTGDQWAVRDDVFIRYETDHGIKKGKLTIGFSGYEGQSHFGPELGFGHFIGDYYDEPVLLIKTAWGGKSLKVDFRPPSAVDKRGGEVGPFYKEMVDQVQECMAAYKEDFPELADSELVISGFVWQQGWNDMVDVDSRKEYLQNLGDLINDLRSEWKTPDLPVVVGELGNGGKAKNDSMKQFRRQQSAICAVPPFVGTVQFILTAHHARPAEESPNVTHLHHWFGNAESYLLVGRSLGVAMVRMLQQPKTPRVLLLGDSISIGYRRTVEENVFNNAFVVRPMVNHQNAENCQGTIHGVKRIDRWLSIGGGDWDVIHFNFGLHDLKHVDPQTRKNSNDPQHPQQSDLIAYEKQLREIVAKLKETNATLIFATTTPVPEGVRPFRSVDAPAKYNDIARKIMEENEIQVNDLFAVANENLADWQKPKDVHFNQTGSEGLGKVVTEVIKKALAERKN